MRRIPENREEYFDARNDAYFMPDTYRQGWGQITGQKTLVFKSLGEYYTYLCKEAGGSNGDSSCANKTFSQITSGRTIIRIPK